MTMYEIQKDQIVFFEYRPSYAERYSIYILYMSQWTNLVWRIYSARHFT